MTCKKTAVLILALIFIYAKGLSQDIRLDHIIIVVANLDSAVEAYKDLGFIVKPGRLHENGLLNAHIKFKNSTSLELMSVRDEPTNDMAREYADLLSHGEGGVYLALAGMPTKELASRLDELNIQYTITAGNNWDYITFPNNPGLAHIFLIDYHVKSNDSEEILTHRNSAQGIETVWLEGDNKVKALLEGLALQPVRSKSDPTLGAGQGYRVMAGNIIVIPNKSPNKRSRIKGISFSNRESTENIIIRF